MMLSGILTKLTMVAVTLAAVYWIGWFVPPRQTADPLQLVDLQELSPHAFEPVPQPLAEKTPSAPSERPQAQGVGPGPARIALNLNRASLQDFERLPGIGPVLAARILEYRAAHGMFHHIDELRQVKGIGPKKFDQIRAHVAVGQPGMTKGPGKTA